MYEIKVGQKTVGYIKEKNEINNYIESTINKNENIAFIDLKEDVSYNLKLVSRNENNKENEITQIEDNLNIEYTTYAITYNKENIAYTSTMEKAEEVIDDLETEKIDTDNVGILQVYSDRYEDIKVDSSEEIIKNDLKEKYFKIKECLSRSGNLVSEISNKKEIEKIFFSLLNTRKKLNNKKI